ncbi:hypothetical protein [Prosthecochloris sp. HL-130-GSB]|uniref:hypothetical protein n=1 Tax=Prosthecochloris sp. HL-130-GSB TaxID=1974213 RepID=UPI000A1C0230|nr:hypothetical protein [Prosthecochloris sp. HL-130-GSB]ARM31903.1 hypothetical protein B9H02_04550 [Prosthecochloris sp. HL-130-GSB]MBO8093507.1 hypothetical protein [Prosthecochloris sp.]
MNRIKLIHTITQRLIIMTAAALLLLSVIFALNYYFDQRFMITWAGLLCGVIGGFVSMQQRLRSVSDQELELLSASWFQILLIPVFGGVFALVLYVILLSGIVSGHIFPEFYFPQRPESGPDSAYILEVLTKTYPNSGEDLAKLLFWLFVAGFSERFVPQIISKVTSSATQQDHMTNG